MNQPNGLAFSPDGKKLYVDDSKLREIRVFDVGVDGNLTNSRVFGKQEGPPRSGSSDGMKVDEKGNLFVTGPMGIWVWSPNGTHLGTIIMPESPANLAWGDKDYRTLYVTAKTSVYRLKTKTRGSAPRRIASPLKVNPKLLFRRDAHDVSRNRSARPEVSGRSPSRDLERSFFSRPQLEKIGSLA